MDQELPSKSWSNYLQCTKALWELNQTTRSTMIAQSANTKLFRTAGGTMILVATLTLEMLAARTTMRWLNKQIGPVGILIAPRSVDPTSDSSPRTLAKTTLSIVAAHGVVGPHPPPGLATKRENTQLRDNLISMVPLARIIMERCNMKLSR